MKKIAFPIAKRHAASWVKRCLAFSFAVSSAHATEIPIVPKNDGDAVAELTRPLSKFEVGIGNASEDSFAAGNYNGLNRAGAFPILNFDLRGAQYKYGNPDDDGARWRLTGTDLGLRARSIAGEYGRQGRYRITFGADEITRLRSDSYQTPFEGAGAARLTLPAGFVRAPDTFGMTTLATSMRDFNLRVDRQKSELGVQVALNPEWEVRAQLRRDQSEGTKWRGAEFGSNGGNARSALLPEPIDSVTHLFDASIAFAELDRRFTLSYHGSFFNNRIAALTWENPYSSVAWTGGGSGLPFNFPLPTGQTSVAPDNQFHQLAASGALDFSPTTRLTLTATRGRMTQNESFLPYTINTGLTTSPLPRTSLSGLVETSFINAKLAMRPMRKLSLNASVKFEERDNKTPMAEYIYVGGDIQLQPPPGANTDRIRTNLPRSRRQEQLILDADYRYSSSTLIKGGLEHTDVTRNYAEVARTRENSARLEWREGGAGALTSSVSYAILQRRGTQYLYNVPFLASYTSPAFIAGLIALNPSGCVNLAECIRPGPFQNKFFMADRNRERARLMLQWVPDAVFSMQARLDANHDRYPHSPYGVTNANSWSAGIDLAYSWNEHTSATFFASRENQSSREKSRQIVNLNPGNPLPPPNADADWINQFSDRAATIGLGIRHVGMLDGKLEINLDAIAVRGRTPISTTVGAAVPPGQNPATPIPDLTMRSDEIKVGARYAIDRRDTLRLGYFFRRLNTADWAVQQVGVATIPVVIGTNEFPARYAQHGVGISWVRVFR